MRLIFLFALGVSGAAVFRRQVPSNGTLSGNSTSSSSVSLGTSSSLTISTTSSTSSSSSSYSTTPDVVSSSTSTTIASNSNATTSSGPASPQDTITPAPTPTSSTLEWWTETDTACWPMDGQYCGRPGNPRYNYQGSLYSNPYRPAVATGVPVIKLGFNSTANDQLNFVCASLFDAAVTSWLQTASIAWNPVIPATVESIIEPAYTIPYESDYFTTSFPWTTEVITSPWSTFTSTFYEYSNSASYSYKTIPAQVTNPWTVPAHSDAYYVTENFKWTPTGACCSSCVLHGGDVQVMHFPTPAPTPAVTELVDKRTNFTYISPSIYVAFHSLWATDMCGSVGTLVPETTLAFSQGELSTFIHRTYVNSYAPNSDWWLTWDFQTFTEASWTSNTITDCNMITSTYWQAYGGYMADQGPWLSEFPNYDAALQFLSTVVQWDLVDLNGGGYTWTSTSFTGLDMSVDGISSYTYSYNPCSPYISLPTKIYTVNPLWTNCVPGIQAFFDPPYTLTPGGDLFAPITTAADPGGQSPVTTTSAAAGSVPTPIVTATQPPSTTAEPTTDPVVVNNPQPTSTTTDPITIVPLTSSSPDPAQLATITLGTSILTINPTSAIVIASQTLTPGGILTLSSTTISLAPNGGTVIIADPTTTYTQAISTSATQSPTAYLIGTQTLAPGSAITISASGSSPATTLSLDPAGSNLIINGKTTPLSTFLPATTTFPFLQSTTTPELILSNSQTLIAGGSALTISGTIFSLASAGNSVLIINNGVTSTLPASILGSVTEVPEIVVAGSQTLIGGGSAITVEGTVMSLQSGGASVVFLDPNGGGATKTVGVSELSGVVTSSSSGLAGWIFSLGGFASEIYTTPTLSSSSRVSAGVVTATSSGGFNGTIFLGGGMALHVREGFWVWISGVVGVMIVLGMGVS